MAWVNMVSESERGAFYEERPTSADGMSLSGQSQGCLRVEPAPTHLFLVRERREKQRWGWLARD
jgi:hypothetical protein